MPSSTRAKRTAFALFWESFILEDASSVGYVTFTVLPISSACYGQAISFTIEINPTPDLNIQTDQNIICSGGITQINLNSSLSNTSFTWQVTTNNVLGAIDGSGNTKLAYGESYLNKNTEQK